MLTGRGESPTHATEALGTRKHAASPRHLLFPLHPPHLPLPLIVVKGKAQVGHAGQPPALEVAKTEQHVHRRRLLGGALVLGTPFRRPRRP